MTGNVSRTSTHYLSQQTEPILRLGISACLLGHEVRYNGAHKRDDFLVHTLGAYVEWYPLCPEVKIGLGVPRETIRLTSSKKEHPRLVATQSGNDHTETMRDWARMQFADIDRRRLHGYVLKRDSPSCGLFRVRVYQDKGAPARDGRGLFADELTRHFPLLPVEEEGRLHDPHLLNPYPKELMLRNHV